MPPIALLWLASVLCLGYTQDLPTGCYQSNYTSTFTRCDLTFLFCFNYVRLQSCVLRKCNRYVRGDECLSQTSFEEDESSCYRNCCGSDHFDQKQCGQYNQIAESKNTANVTNLTIALTIIASFLLAAVIFFVIKRLRCCDKGEPFILIRFNVKWRKALYEDNKCGICHTYGSMLTTNCQHHFHVSCFEDNSQEMKCPTCDEPLRDRIKIFCFLCRQKAFKVKIAKVTDIADAIIEGKALHIDECPREPRTNMLKT